MKSRTSPPSSGVPRAPPKNGATGFPYRHRLSAYQRPPMAAALTATTATPRNDRSRWRTIGHAHAATTTIRPGYFAPAATPANSPAAASSAVLPPTRQNAAAVVAASNRRSSFADATRNAVTGAPTAITTAAATCSVRSHTRRANALTTPIHNNHSSAVSAPSRSPPVCSIYASRIACDCGHMDRA